LLAGVFIEHRARTIWPAGFCFKTGPTMCDRSSAI
jgi:hypothetical protein